jgi:hypothetical protein
MHFCIAMPARRQDRLLRMRKWRFVLAGAAVILLLALFVPFQTCPACKGTGAWNADPRFEGQCSAGCGGSGHRSLWTRLFPAAAKELRPVAPPR